MDQISVSVLEIFNLCGNIDGVGRVGNIIHKSFAPALTIAGKVIQQQQFCEANYVQFVCDYE